MRLVIQRVSRASVAIEGRTVSGIGNGLLVLVGVETGDTEEDMRWLVGKTVGLRIFNDENGVMNMSVVDVGGEVLAVSQFTLTASTKKGNRPSYIRAAGHDLAVPLYEKYCEEVSAAIGKPVGKGVFGADMQVSLVNDGPVTIIIDSRIREYIHSRSMNIITSVTTRCCRNDKPYSSRAILGIKVMSAGSHSTEPSCTAVSQRAASCSTR